MENSNEKPLTLNELVKYNQEVLFPFMEEHFVGKEAAKDFVVKKDFDDFKNKSLSNQDSILEKLGTLLQEKNSRAVIRN